PAPFQEARPTATIRRRDRSCAVVRAGDPVLMVRQTDRGATVSALPDGLIELGETRSRRPPARCGRRPVSRVEVGRRLLEMPRSGGAGTYYLHVGRLVGGALALGADPELADAPPELHDVRWLPIA